MSSYHVLIRVDSEKLKDVLSTIENQGFYTLRPDGLIPGTKMNRIFFPADDNNDVRFLVAAKNEEELMFLKLIAGEHIKKIRVLNEYLSRTQVGQ